MDARPHTRLRIVAVVGALMLALAGGSASADELGRFLKKSAKGKATKGAKGSKSAKPPTAEADLGDPTPAHQSAAAPASRSATLDDPPAPEARKATHAQGRLPPAGDDAGGAPPLTEIATRAGPKNAPPGPIGKPGDQRAILALAVNLIDKGEAFVVLRGHDVLLLVSDLEGAGVKNFTGLREPIGGKLHVSLQSLASSGISYELDERALTLKVTAQSVDLGHTSIDLGGTRPQGVISSDEGSGFLNYALRLQDFRHVSAFSEAGATYKNGLAYTQVNVLSDGRAVRGLSNVSYALPEQMQRVVLGDAFAASGPLGGGVLLGGASYLRDFGLDPYFFRYPSAGLAGAVATPSTVDVYVNGTLVHRQELAPGTFDVSNLPLPVGAGNTRIVVRDAYGREQVVATPFYFSTGVLKPGVSDFAFHGGFRRNNLATDNWNYSPPVFLGRYRFGLTPYLTPGARIEGQNGQVSGGAQATMRTPLGDVEAAVAGSYDRTPAPGFNWTTGTAGSLAYTYLRSTLTAGALVRGYSHYYSNLALPMTRDRPLVDANAYVGSSFGPRVSLTLRGGAARWRDAGDTNTFGLLSTVKLHELANLFVTASRTTAAAATKPLYEIFANLTFALPDRATASTFYNQSGSVAQGGVEASRSLSLGPDYGYRVRASMGPTNDFLALGQAQSAYGRYEAGVERIGDQTTSLVSASGSLVTAGGHVFASRPVQQGFGVIEVPGVEGVRGRLNNQDIGRTDSNGNLLVPEMIPYYANKVSIADEDLPMDYKIGHTERLLAPPLLGGAVARFEVEKLRVVTGSIVMNVGGADVFPSYGQLVVHQGLAENASPLGKQGEFYLENLQPGRYPAELDSAKGTCRFDLVVPASDAAFIDAGRTRCIGAAVSSAAPAGTVEPLPAAVPAETPPAESLPPAKRTGKNKP
jgi:outer membrane usher protein